jgi:UDP-glucose 4-epimerase
VFGSDINEENLKLFFDIPWIKQLWWGNHGFISSHMYKNFFDNLNENITDNLNNTEKQAFLKYFEPLAPQFKTFDIN